MPRVINVDKNAVITPRQLTHVTIDQTLPETTQLRPVKYLNNMVEQDHRFIKRLVNPGMGFGSFNTARRTLRGYEAMNMIRTRTSSRSRKRKHFRSSRIRVENFRSCGITSGEARRSSVLKLFLQHNPNPCCTVHS